MIGENKMKKNLPLLLSMLLILSMLLSIFVKVVSLRDDSGALPSGPSEIMSEKQDLRINLRTEPTSLYPGQAKDTASNTVILQMFEGLTRIDLWGQRQNAMAEVIKISDDQKTYTFTLRDAKWSNGDPVIARDFEYSWKWILDPANQSAYANNLYYIEGAESYYNGKGNVEGVGVKALDDKTLQVKLVNPTPHFLELISSLAYLPVNSKIASKNPDWADDANKYYTTNGPFQLSKWTHGEKITLKKNKNYWDANTVKLTTITMHMVNDQDTELSMYEDGKLDWAGMPAGNLPKDIIPFLKESGFLHSKSIAGIYSYKFNTTVEPFNNVNIRNAFALAINRKEVIKLLEGNQLPAMAVIPTRVFSNYETEEYFRDHDVKKAKEYLQKGLEELGYRDVSELQDISVLFTSENQHQDIAQAVQKMWEENLGVNVTLKSQNSDMYNTSVQKLNYQVVQHNWIGDYNDPISFFEMYSNNDGRGNDWNNENFQALLEQARTDLDSVKRQALLKDAEEILMKDMPEIPIYFITNNWVQKGNLKDVAVTNRGDVQFKWAYLIN